MHKPPKPPFKRQIENLNEGIRAKELLVIFPDESKQTLSTYTAIQRAREIGLDVVVVAPNATPPVAKMMEYGEFKYEQKKKAKAARKNQFIQQTKELKFRPNTDDHDYEFKLKHAVEFLKEGHKVKATCQFRGREMAHTDLGKQLLQRLIVALAGVGTVEGTPRMEAKTCQCLFSPVKKN